VLSNAGAAHSATSPQPLSILAGVYHVNGVSTSSALDQTDNYPTFVCTVPNNSFDSLAVITYLALLRVTQWCYLGRKPLWLLLSLQEAFKTQHTSFE
jgi:hypothetical protein